MSLRSASNQALARVLRPSISDMSIWNSRLYPPSLRAKRSNPSCCEKEWIASSLTLLAMTAKVTLSLRPEISTALVATVAMNADTRDLAGVLDPLEDIARNIFQRRRSQRLDLVEELVVERLAHLFDAALEQAEVHHHAGGRIGRAAHAHLGAKRVAVNFLAVRAEGRPLQRMRGFEAK